MAGFRLIKAKEEATNLGTKMSVFASEFLGQFQLWFQTLVPANTHPGISRDGLNSWNFPIHPGDPGNILNSQCVLLASPGHSGHWE